MLATTTPTMRSMSAVSAQERDEEAVLRRALVRGSLAAVASTALALALHLLAGGALPAAPGLLVPLTLAVGACVLLDRIRLTTPRLLLSVAASQLLFHGLFQMGAAPASSGSSVHAGHAVHIDQASATSAVGPALVEHAVHLTPLMVGAHLLATLVTVVALLRGEAVLATIAATTRHWVSRALGAPAPVALRARTSTPAQQPARLPTSLLVVTTQARRGPPVRFLPTLT